MKGWLVIGMAGLGVPILIGIFQGVDGSAGYYLGLVVAALLTVFYEDELRKWYKKDD